MPNGLQNLEEDKHKNTGTKRQREIVKVQRPEAKEAACERPKKRQAQHRRDIEKDPDKHWIRGAIALAVAG